MAEKTEKKRHEKLAWAIHEWDCSNLEEAKKIARVDRNLWLILVECGVKFDKET